MEAVQIQPYFSSTKQKFFPHSNGVHIFQFFTFKNSVILFFPYTARLCSPGATRRLYKGLKLVAHIR